jgi:hypothetical protein
LKTCPDCNGDGVIEKGTDDEQQCPTCGGSGFVPDDDDDDDEVTRTASWWPNPAKWAANVAFGSKTVLARCPCHVRFPPDSDQIADITARRRRARRRHQLPG